MKVLNGFARDAEKASLQELTERKNALEVLKRWPKFSKEFDSAGFNGIEFVLHEELRRRFIGALSRGEMR